MTTTLDAPATPPPAPSRRVWSGAGLAGQMLLILGAVLLCFVAQVTLLGALKHDRDQARAHEDLRYALANATAPVSALDEEGRLLPSATPMAILEIPRIGLREVVGEGTSATALTSGPGHLRATPFPGQPGTSVIFGRRAAYGGPFALLHTLRQGDRITVTTGQGEHTYQVQGIRRPGDPQRPAPAAGAGALTLVSADGSYFLPTDALRVDAKLTSPAQPAAGTIPAFAVPDDERAMAGDSGALIPTALWGLVLLAAALAVVWVRRRVGRWQSWVAGVPVLVALALTTADHAAALLPNLL